ncbi:iron(III) transport system substrate-binding protein [Humitalea rosea]|uniref:Iron(III) transport system substrate-binding protein n=2 Tax=Humitalea rosea TaxID=990373 RepID=A0A2W7HVD1_9PROT|nr:iron(III) transport system substrate-binding protein [Humitalea rosea]
MDHRFRPGLGMTRRSAIAALATLAATRQAAAQQQQPGWAEVVAGAKREGRVVFYCNLQPNGIEPLLQLFRTANPGIRTEYIRLGSGPLIERFQTEFNAGRNIADVLITFPDERFDEGLERGWAQHWTPPELPHFPPGIVRAGAAFALHQSRECIIWNRGLVRDADAPKEWADLMDPRWRGKVAMNPPWRSVAVQQLVAYWEDIGIRDAAERMRANEVRFFEGSGGVIQAVVRGDVRIAHLTDLPLNPMLEDGAPIGYVYPASGTTTSSGFIIAAGRAPNPNAARVLVNWLMTGPGQEALQRLGGLPVTRTDAPPLSKIPATASLPKVVNGESILTPERQARMISHWRTVFGVR